MHNVDTLNFKVLRIKGTASLQDLGRPKAQHLGFSASGAADEYSFLLGNKLLGNAPNTPGLEITLGQLTLQAQSPCLIALTGADCQANINGKKIDNHRAVQLFKSDILELKMPKTMLHTYLSIKGGFKGQIFYESVAFSRNEINLAVFNQPIAVGQNIPFNNADTGLANTDKKDILQKRLTTESHHYFHQASSYEQPLALRFMPSLLWQKLSTTQQQLFLAEKLKVHTHSNRMGYRLTAESIITKTFNTEQKKCFQQLSKAVSFGTIQLPENGQPIVLMKERQTIGGYPVLGCVMQTDLFRLSQKRPGEYVRFIPIEVTKAQQQLLAFQQNFHAQ